MTLKNIKPNYLLITFLWLFSFIPNTNAEPELMPSPPKIAAKAWVLMSYQSGQIIASDNEREQLAPASLAKIMTSYVVGQELKAGHIAADDKVIISESAWGKKFPGSSKMFLNVGDEVSVDDLNHGVIIASGNDATVALAEHVAGHQSAFVEMMNIHAQKIGMMDSYFANPHGLDSEGQVTTAYDMALLTRSFIHELPDIYPLFKEKSFKFGDIKQGNRNALLWDTTLNVDGVKTGYTKNAGYSLVSSAIQNEQRLIAVVMGTQSPDARRTESKKLLTWGFRFFQDITPQFSGKELSPLKVWYGSPSTISLEVADGGIITVPRRQRKDLEYKISYNHELEAPVSKGQQVGKVEWYLGEKLLTEQPILAAEAADEAPWYKKIIDMVWRPIAQWFTDRDWGSFGG
ncbi:D-alanyl-D-alanine carboxypeptidase family protein [Photobacterium sp. J15]|uniref:D-alanyl-D-alanine carboxypeptidase family protein n=1 Tax=Photobacterium sp. J15 TaxID=265901 RepID=UPI0007E31B1A|nr:D-alanyl-D-alanine carboxypeptidase family protein [Photobacterium sp. J15]